MSISKEKALELAVVMRTLKCERIDRSRDQNGNGRADETSVALAEAQRFFEETAEQS